MLTILMPLAVAVAAAFNMTVQAIYFTHMLQLNSYRPERYQKWYRENDKKVLKKSRVMPALIFLLMFLKTGSLKVPEWVIFAGAAILLLIAGILNIPKKAKKPLVWTARVRRVMATQWLLLAVVLAVFGLLVRFDTGAGLLRGLTVVTVYSVLIWFWTDIANRINLPLENHIANGYVKDARRILADCPDLTVIGITGSYGKTSTKTFLQALLSVKYNVLMTPGSYNTTMGVVRTVREQLRPSHDIFIAEMGAKNPGDIQEICDLVHPRFGVLTAIGEQHLETFKTIDNIVRTKFELIDALPKAGKAFVNIDNPYIRDRVDEGGFAAPVVSYGLNDADVAVSDMSVDHSGCSFTVTARGESQRFTTHLLGAHNIQNLAGCIAVALELGIPLKDMVYAVRTLKPVQHRLQLLPNGFIDDAYNANPAGFRSALDVLKGFSCQRVLVTPGMVELGKRQDALNKELGGYAAGCCDFAVLVGEKQAPPLKAGLLEAGFPDKQIFVVRTLQEGLRVINHLPASPRIVLLENDLPDNF